jgi:hypothetical protein
MAADACGFEKLEDLASPDGWAVAISTITVAVPVPGKVDSDDPSSSFGQQLAARLSNQAFRRVILMPVNPSSGSAGGSWVPCPTEVPPLERRRMNPANQRPLLDGSPPMKRQITASVRAVLPLGGEVE